jgi:hypothetical protein
MTRILGIKVTISVVIAAFIGISAYTSNITALPLISGLLSLGMNPDTKSLKISHFSYLFFV